MPFAGVVIGSAVVGAAANIYSSNKAASAQKHATDSANAEAQRQYDQTRQDQGPYRTAGYSALSRINDLLGLSSNTSAPGYGSFARPISVEDVTKDPGYQFGLNQGIKTQQNSAAARGGLYSGAELKALTQYGNDYATTKYDDAYSRAKNEQDTVFNRLSGVSGTGQTATTTVDNLGNQTAQTIGGNLIGAGNARGAADIAAGNAVGSGVNQAAAWWLRSQPGANPGSPGGYGYGSSGGGVGTGAWTDPSTGQIYNNPSAYTGP